MGRERLVLLHGSNGSSRELAPLAQRLRRFDLFVPDLVGHGGRPVPHRLTFEAMVDDLAAQLDTAKIQSAHFLGYSFGGYLALGLALRDPKRVRSLIGIAVKYLWTADAVRHVVHLLDPQRLGRPGNPRRAELEQVHGAERWREVALMNRGFFTSLADGRGPLTDAALGAIAAPALILTGDIDPLVPEPEARRLAAALPQARLGLWPGSAHPLRNVPLVEVKYAVAAFIRDVEQGTFTPGDPLRLERKLVTGGVPWGGIGLRIRPSRSG